MAKILLIDDSKMSRKMLRTILAEARESLEPRMQRLQ